jgi:hypothetical protein
LISGDERFEVDSPSRVAFQTSEEQENRFQWLDSFFELPVCRKCAFAASPRSARPLSLEYVPRRHDGAFGFIGPWGTTVLQIVSDEFIDLLTAEERGRLQFRAANGRGRVSRFYELAGPAGPPFVAVAGMKISGWRCTACGFRTWGYSIEGMAIESFVARSDVPAPLEGVFTVGVPPDIHLAVTAGRWQELVGRKGTRGFVSRLLGVVPDHEVVRHPDLATYEERLRESGTGRSS